MDMHSTIGLVIADDHPMTVLGLSALFDAEADFSLLGTADNGIDVIRTVRECAPDVLLLDIAMPKQDGLSVLRELHAEKVSCKTILHTYQIDDERLVQAMQYGVWGVVMKTLPPPVLLKAVRTVYAGERWLEMDNVSRALVNKHNHDIRRKQVCELLTSRELELVKIVAKGLRNKAISEQLHIQEGTVRIHLHNIYAKLELDGRGALIAFAQQNGFT